MAGKREKKQKGGAADRQGKRRKKGEAPKRLDIEFPENEEDHEESDVSEEDLQFVESFGNKIGFLANLDKKALDRSVKEKQRKETAADAKQPASKKAAAAAVAASDDDDGGDPEDADEDSGPEAEVADYEKAPRHVDKAAQRERGSLGLPVKTLDGQVMYQAKEQRKQLRRAAADEEPRAAAQEGMVLASDLGIKVAGVTIQDELEEEHKQQAALEQKAERARKSEQKKQKEEAEEAATGLPSALASSLRSIKDEAQKRQALKEAMAVSAQKLLASPEDHVAELKTLLALAADQDAQVSRLGLLSLLAVFRDIVPGYRIRLPSEQELQVKVSKEVQALRSFEVALLRSYQAYLKLLLAALHHRGAPEEGARPQQQQQQRGSSSIAHARIAVKCMCQLLVSLPHFNYISDLLQAVVPRMAARDPEIRSQCCEAVRQLLQSDVDGGIALEAVQLVADLVKTRKCDCPPDVVRALAVLTFSDVKPNKEEDDGAPAGIDKALEKKMAKKPGKRAAAAAKHGAHVPAAWVEAAKAKKASNRELRKDVDRSFREAEAGPDSRLRAQRQSQMLEALFEVYFRVLKHCTSSGLASMERAAKQGAAALDKAPGGAAGNGKAPAAASASASASGGAGGSETGPDTAGLGWSREQVLRKFPLLYPSLEGLARYTHLISIEYFNDLMEVFKQLLASAALPLVDRLRLLLTASNILRGQGDALTIDRREFYVQLYNTLTLTPFSQVTECPLEGQGSESQDDEPLPSTSAFSDQESLAVLLASTMQQMLCDVKISDTGRVAAFLKRVASVLLSCGSAEAMGLMGAMLRMLRRYPHLLTMLEFEGEAPVGGRMFDACCSDPSEAGAQAASLWELALLTHHYHPHVVQAATSLLAMAPRNGGAAQLSGPLAVAGTARELALAYDTCKGAFKPAPVVPGAKKRGLSSSLARRLQQAAKVSAASDEMLALLDGLQAADASILDDESGAAQAEATLRQHYRVLREFERNKELRREKSILSEKLRQFADHLAQKKKTKKIKR